MSVMQISILPDEAGVDERLALAMDADTPVERLRELARDPRVDVRQFVARNRSCPGDVLLALSLTMGAEDVVMRYYIAGNRNTPLDVLRTLVRDEDLSVRCAVARNPSATDELLGSLVEDVSEDVRLALARRGYRGAHRISEGVAVDDAQPGVER